MTRKPIRFSSRFITSLLTFFCLALSNQAFAQDYLTPVYRFSDLKGAIEVLELPKHTLPPEFQSGWAKKVDIPQEQWNLLGPCGLGSNTQVWQTRIEHQVLTTAEAPTGVTATVCVWKDGQPLQTCLERIFTLDSRPGLCYFDPENNLTVSTPVIELGGKPSGHYEYDYRLRQSLYSFAASGLSLTDFIFRRGEIDKETRIGLYAPPPSQLAFPVTIPSNSVLEFHYGVMREMELGLSDGVRFAAIWKPANGQEKEIWTASILLNDIVSNPKWRFQRVSLDELAGQSGKLVFATYPYPSAEKGPQTANSEVKTPNGFYDYAIWGQPTISTFSKGDQPPPNVLLIACDALRGDVLGFSGNPRGASPILDELAKHSVVYMNCFSQAPWTPPSFTSLFTSCYPRAHGVTGYHGMKVPPRLRTLAEILYGKGYTTFGIANNSNIGRLFGLDRGFETYTEMLGFDDRTTDRAIDFLKSNRNKATFTFLHYMCTHRDYAKDPAFRYKFFSSRPAVDPLDIILKLAPESVLKTANEDEAQKGVRDIYYGSVSFFDFQISRLLSALKEMNLSERTLIIVTADHGEELWDHGEFGHGHTLYNELLHIPLLFAYPGLPAREVTSFVRSVDISPTITGFLEIPRGTWNPVSVGRDLNLTNPQPTEKEFGTKEPFVCAMGEEDAANAGYDCMYSGVMKMILKLREPLGLYDLSQDYNERNNLLDSKPELAQTMIAQLRAMDEKCDAQCQHLKAGSIIQKPQMDKDTETQLRSIGYLN